MDALSKLLKALIDNPDDLSSLPQLVARAEELEQAEGQYLERIAKLQDINKKYLAQIPVPGEEVTGQEQQDDEPTLEDASKYLVEFLKGE